MTISAIILLILFIIHHTMSTTKLFTEDAYQQECDATVVEVLDIPQESLSENEDGRSRILVLDQTVFYALSGGQPWGYRINNIYSPF
jgi:alanyl-tRNA synthetase